MDNRLSDGNPSFEFEHVEGEVNMNGSNMAEVLSEQKRQDIRDIERLQAQVDGMISRITIKDISQLSAMGKSVEASQDFRKEFYQMSMRPTVLSNES